MKERIESAIDATKSRLLRVESNLLDKIAQEESGLSSTWIGDLARERQSIIKETKLNMQKESYESQVSELQEQIQRQESQIILLQTELNIAEASVRIQEIELDESQSSLLSEVMTRDQLAQFLNTAAEDSARDLYTIQEQSNRISVLVAELELMQLQLRIANTRSLELETEIPASSISESDFAEVLTEKEGLKNENAILRQTVLVLQFLLNSKNMNLNSEEQVVIDRIQSLVDQNTPEGLKQAHEAVQYLQQSELIVINPFDQNQYEESQEIDFFDVMSGGNQANAIIQESINLGNYQGLFNQLLVLTLPQKVEAISILSQQEYQIRFADVSLRLKQSVTEEFERLGASQKSLIVQNQSLVRILKKQAESNQTTRDELTEAKERLGLSQKLIETLQRLSIENNIKSASEHLQSNQKKEAIDVIREIHKAFVTIDKQILDLLLDPQKPNTLSYLLSKYSEDRIQWLAQSIRSDIRIMQDQMLFIESKWNDSGVLLSSVCQNFLDNARRLDQKLKTYKIQDNKA
jgi:hypothetical protein